MSAFNPKKKDLPAICWQKLAHDSLEQSSSGSQALIVGGILGGLLGASVTGFPPTGLLIGGWAFYEAWKRTDALNKNEEAIARHGCVAHVLKGDKLRDFSAQVGVQEVQRQIEWASQNGYSLTADAEEFLEAQEQSESVVGAGETQSNPNLVGAIATMFKRREPSVKDVSAASPQTAPKISDLITVLESSAIAPVLMAGFLKAVGGQGSGKTTLVNGGLIRYRLHKGHKFIVINAHKKHGMYRGLEPHLVAGSEFYGVGQDDKERGDSIRQGIDKVLSIVESRYTEYQNQPEGTYNHYPITLILEECGEWASLLGGDEEFVQRFWQKMLVASRKAVVFPIATAQSDSMTMFGNPKGLSELLKSSGCVTLCLIPEVDPKSADGWKPSGFCDLTVPGTEKKRRISIPNLRSLVENPDVFASDRSSQSFQPTQQTQDWDAARQRLNHAWQMPSAAEPPEPQSEPSEPPREPLNQPNDNTSSDFDIRFTPMELTRSQAVRLIEQLRTELNQTQIIERLWQVSKGGSAAWKEAYAQFKELTGGTGDE
ncbi:hypothetical protein NDI44_27215 [Trichocoleus sp. DQ-A3]|uniref:hypothetical protein n=1 Tax=Cyanophyceae TaxID=3028117 RepID=UPI0016829949|nr:hypothetical protein [Coleofasciculus sp. FACHB-125]MBD1903877.1 hypothetical protein [Coleofasciculus sp. FACHB-125]